ncbi:hypothetical protein [Nonomuraea sp. NPDC049646]|uniref:hypothetical protein n=1 Tax=unclassified Nonomuraea TaxID=2593643 RepID=UPI0037B00CB5
MTAESPPSTARTSGYLRRHAGRTATARRAVPNTIATARRPETSARTSPGAGAPIGGGPIS